MKTKKKPTYILQKCELLMSCIDSNGNIE